jgi:hypothetical protein
MSVDFAPAPIPRLRTSQEAPGKPLSLWMIALTPLGFYAAALFILTWPAALYFSSEFLTGPDDGLQNVWNLWWVNKALTQLHTLPFFTHMLHYPRGTTLLGHTLNPFNGLLAIPLLRIFTLVQTHNLIVAFSFIMTGWTTFLLAHRFSRSWSGSLLAGFVVTFSAYHFAHARGHLQLISMEWIPLFLLLWHELITRPAIRTALAAAGALLLVDLCDHYYSFYCVMMAVPMLAWQMLRTRSWRLPFQRPMRWPLLAFLIAAVPTTGVLAWAVLRADARDPLYFAHNPHDWSNDLVAAFIPGLTWRFGDLTRGYWSAFLETPRNAVEICVYVGWALLILAAISWKRRKSPQTYFAFWATMAVVFFLLSLGPSLGAFGHDLRIPMPYAAFEKLFPPLRMSGVPVRMMCMVQIALAVLAACGWSSLQATARGRAVIAALAMLALIETAPAPLLHTLPSTPPYVTALATLPDRGGTLDLVSDMYNGLYHQTIHAKPLAFGYISREPKSVWEAREYIWMLLDLEDYQRLRQELNFGYLICDWPQEHPSLRPVYHDDDVWIYEIQ